MPSRWLEGEIINIVQAAPRTRKYFVKVSSEVKIHWIPGQFVVMDLPVGEKRLDRWRSYSIANIPNEENILEFCIVQLEGGLGTAYLFDQVAVGDSLKFKKPDGTFCLPDKIDHEMIMVCTGTGLAPFRSMLLEIESKGIAHKGLHLIFGTRKYETVLYEDDMMRWKHTIPNFKYDIALSREKRDGFSSGYVHPIYQEQYKEKIAERKFYLCGWSQMIDQAVANIFADMGYERTQIIYELYG